MTTVLDQAADYSWMPRILETVTSYFSHLLWTSPDAEPARALLAKRRISDESAKAFRLGFAPPGWETTHRNLRSEGIAVEQLELLGLAIARKKTSGHFDKFRSRLIFPITASHQVVALAGRTVLTNDPGPKYTRTLSTPLSRTTTALFGLDQAEVHVAATGMVLLVEGFIDAIVLHQHGLRATAALSGTALSDEEIALLARGGARSMALLFDGDAGGRAAARHLASRLRHAPLPSTIAFCPEGQDPDDVVRADGPRS